MSVKEFALDPMGSHRIQVHWLSDNEPVTILLNGSQFGSLTTLTERTTGRDFTLPDGSLLHIRFVENQPQAFRNGFPLAAAAPIADPIPTPRRRGGCLTAWLILNLVSMGIITLLNLIAIFGAISLGDAGLAFGALLFVLLGIVGMTGISILLLWKKWGFYLVVVYVIGSIVLSFPLGLVDFRTFTPLIGLVILYYILRRTNVWAHLT